MEQATRLSDSVGLPEVSAFFDPSTSTLSYLVVDPASSCAAIVDPVWDYCAQSGRLEERSLDVIAQEVETRGLSVDWVLDTHPHADHLTGAARAKERLGGQTGIGRGLLDVQRSWKAVYNLGDELPIDGSHYDRLFDDGERFALGNLEIEALHTPGHTPACVTYLVGDAAFVGDTLFMPDFGTARCDFPGGDARILYRSIARILSLPAQTRLFTCHDYRPGGRPLAWESHVAGQRAENLHVRDGVSEDDFVALRNSRDENLNLPELLLPALQVNIRGGRLPAAEDDGHHYLKIPLNRF